MRKSRLYVGVVYVITFTWINPSSSTVAVCDTQMSWVGNKLHVWTATEVEQLLKFSELYVELDAWLHWTDIFACRSTLYTLQNSNYMYW